MHGHWTLRLYHERIALRLPVAGLVMLFGLLLLLMAVVSLSLTLGSFPMTLADAIRVLLGDQSNRQMQLVVWEFRFPRALVSALVGAMLGLSGAALQNVTRNALADPSLVGISQGAGLAVVALSVLKPEWLSHWRPVAALLGSLSVAVMIQLLTLNRQGGSSIRFILMGIGFAAFISALTSVLMTYGQIDRAMSALAWLSGSINAASWRDVHLLSLALLLLLPSLLLLSRLMAVQTLGEASAIGLGAPVRSLRYALITVAVALAAIATAVVGPLAFVGLIAPHVARSLSRTGLGLHLLITAGFGALLVACADLLGRVAVAPVQVPAGIVTAIIGVPFFIYLLLRSGKSHRQ